MCRRNREDREHLFLTCPFAISIRKRLKRLLNWNNHRQNVSLLCKHVSRAKQKNKKEIILFNSLTIPLYEAFGLKETIKLSATNRNPLLIFGKKSKLLSHNSFKSQCFWLDLYLLGCLGFSLVLFCYCPYFLYFFRLY